MVMEGFVRMWDDLRTYLRLFRTLLRIHWLGMVITGFAVFLIGSCSIHLIQPSMIRLERKILLQNKQDGNYEEIPSPHTTLSETIKQYLTRSSVGVLFPTLLAIVTITGFLISIQKLEEFLGKVTSLKAFLEKAVPILEEAQKMKEDIHIVCYAPYIGNLSERGTGLQLRFAKLLLDRVQYERTRTIIVSLNAEALSDYYNRFALDSRYEEVDVSEALKEQKHILQECASKSFNNVAYYGLPPKAMLPSFFMVAAESRAVIAMPLFVPPGDSTKTTTVDMKIELVGFCTNDVATIREFKEAMNLYYDNDWLLTNGAIVSTIEEGAKLIKKARSS
jgi:hypothetical protein